MEEKVLIKSHIDQKAKNFLQKAPIVLLAITAFISICLAIPQEVEVYSYWYGYSIEKVVGWCYLFVFGDFTKFFLLFIVASLCFIAAVVIGIMYFVNCKCEMQITESNVKGKTLLGKEVVLPLYMVSAYSTRKFLSVIAVATASGTTKFSLIGNYKEIGEVLAKMINKRQQNTETTTMQSSDNTAMEDIVKLKSLLDAGVITQEEFEAKKKQLLGL